MGSITFMYKIGSLASWVLYSPLVLKQMSQIFPKTKIQQRGLQFIVNLIIFQSENLVPIRRFPERMVQLKGRVPSDANADGS